MRESSHTVNSQCRCLPPSCLHGKKGPEMLQISTSPHASSTWGIKRQTKGPMGIYQLGRQPICYCFLPILTLFSILFLCSSALLKEVDKASLRTTVRDFTPSLPCLQAITLPCLLQTGLPKRGRAGSFWLKRKSTVVDNACLLAPYTSQGQVSL